MKSWQHTIKREMETKSSKRYVRLLNREERDFRKELKLADGNDIPDMHWPSIQWTTETRMTKAQVEAIEPLLEQGIIVKCAVMHKENKGTAIVLRDGPLWILVYEDGRMVHGRLPKFLESSAWTVRLNKNLAKKSSALKQTACGGYSLSRYA